MLNNYLYHLNLSGTVLAASVFPSLLCPAGIFYHLIKLNLTLSFSVSSLHQSLNFLAITINNLVLKFESINDGRAANIRITI